MSPLEAPRIAAWRGSDFAAPDARLLTQSLARALRDVARATPRAVAVIQDGKVVTFGQLWRLVQGLAAELHSVQAPEGPVAVLLQASPLSVAAWFACAWAGRPFVLLEPGNPADRNRMQIAKAGAAILLHDQELDGVELPRLGPSGRPGKALGPGLGPDAPAMLFPTSGSTGEPKLITYAARTLQVKLRASQGVMRVQPGDRVLIAGSHANYGFLHHAMVFLLAGGALCLIDVKARGLPGLYAAIQDQGVRHVRFTPSLFRLAAARPEGAAALSLLKGLRFSGEPLLTADLDLARRVAPGALIQNVYGSTESALFAWTDRGQVLPPGTVPIGRIYPLSTFTLRSEKGGHVPPGEMGELVIRSQHHALGDWQGGGIDLSRFPAARRGRLYATGDVARLTPSGDLEVLGRSDRVVKINGQRVSLDEIESHIAKAPGVGQVAVAMKETARGNPLVAFVTGQASDLRDRLKTLLPPHMIPGQFAWRDDLPLLPGGKTDRKALLASLAETQADTEAEGLEALFARLLKLPSVGPDADFFSLGGDSLLLLDLQMEVQARYGCSFEAKAFIARATIRGLSRLIGLSETTKAPALTGRAEGAEVSFRRIRTGTRGVALVMPGYVGGAAVETWDQAGIFPDHDLWACDAAYARGRTVDKPNWMHAIRAILRAIQTGAAPEPTLTAGYSIAGYIAWATARHLPRPPRVVMVDSCPLHRWPGFAIEGWDPLLPASSVEALQLHRDQPARLALPSGKKRLWTEEEGRILHHPIATLDHIEMGKPEVLAHLAPLANAFAAGAPLLAPGPVPRTLGARILAQWQRPEGPDPDEVEALLGESHALRGTNARLALLYLAVMSASPGTARALADRVAAAEPDLAVPALAQERLQKVRAAPRLNWQGFGRRMVLRAVDVKTMERAFAVRRGAE